MRLKHFLSVFLTLLTFSVGQMWGAVDYIIPKLYLTSKNTPSGNTGWTFTDATANNASTDYWKMIKSTSVVTSPTFDISSYSSVTVSVKWQNFGSFNSAKCNATIKISTGSNTWYTLGTTGLTAAGTTTKTFSDVETHSSYSSAQIQISTPSADNSVGGRLFIVEIKGEAATTCSTPPTVGTNLTSVSASTNSITATVPISSIGGCNITENGLVYSTTATTPTIGGTGCTKVTTTACGATAANKTVTINELSCGTTYYVRGFATNGANTSYTNVTTQATSACPKYTVTLKDDDTELEQATAGASVTLPSRTGCTGYTFAGWTKSWTSDQSSWTTSAPTIITAGNYTPTANENLYPVYTKTVGSGTAGATITTSLTQGKTYVFGAVKATASSTLAENTAIAAVAFTSTASWGAYVTLTPSNAGVITSGITDACKWTLTSVSNGAYTFKNGDNYLSLGTGTGASSAGVSENTSSVYIEDQNTTCAKAFFIHPTSTSTNRLLCNTGNNYGYRMYTSSTNPSASMCPYVRFYEYSSGSTTSYISVPNCCKSLDQINGSVSSTQPEDYAKKTVEWTIPVDGSSQKKAAGVIVKLYADNNNAKGAEITAKKADYSSDNTTTSHTFEGLDPSTKYWFTITLIGGTASGVTYCDSEEGTAVSFTTGAASNSWTITYNANADNVTNMPDVTYADKTSGEGTLSSSVPVRAGYTFLGWDKVDDATIATYSAGGTITGVDDDTDLYAIWERRDVTLSAGSGSVTSSTLVPNAQGKVTLPSATPSAACAEVGWEFVGWAEAEATGDKPATIIPAGEYTPAAKITLYAVYGELGNVYTKTTTLTSGNYVFATNTGKALNNVLNDANKAEGKAVTITSGTTISTTSSDADIIWLVTKSSNNYTLYNAAIEKYLNIVPNDNNNYGHFGLEESSRNYTVDMSNGDVRLWATATTDNQVIEFYNAFTCYSSVGSTLIYAFKQDYDSYQTSPNCTAYTLSSAVDPANKGNVVLGKTSLLTNAQTTAEATPVEGYHFLHWTISGTGATMSNTSEGKSTDNPVTITMGSANATITAHFEQIPTHDIMFSVNGNVADGLTLTLSEGASISFPNESDVTLPDYTNKRFVGWIESPSIANPAVAPSFVTSAVVGNADKTYYAVMADVTEGDYEKLTSTTGLAAGDKLVATDGDAVGMKAYDSGNNFRGAAITIANNKITVLGDACELTLGGESGHWTLFDGSNYIYAAGSAKSGSGYNNYMKGKAEADDACLWTISISSGDATITSTSNTATPYMRYNNNNTSVFSCYNSSSSQNAVVLFKKAISISDYVTTVAPLDHLTISGEFQTTYKKGATLDLTGMVVTATYGTGEGARNRTLASDAYTVDLVGEELATTDNKFVVSFGGKTAEQAIHVYALSGITITSAPTKKTYKAGETFAPAGLKIQATWGGSATDKIVESNISTGFTYSPTTAFGNDGDANISVDVTISYTHEGVTQTAVQVVTVEPLANLVMTWNVAGTTTTSKIYVNAQDKYLLELPEDDPEVPEGFGTGYVFKGWTSDATIAKNGQGIHWAADDDEMPGATEFKAVFALKSGEDVAAGYKLVDAAPADGENVIITRLVSGTYYAMTSAQTPSSSALTITNGVVSGSTSGILWTVEEATGGVNLGASSNYLHMNSSALKVASGTDNGNILFTSNGDGSYKAARISATDPSITTDRWIVTNGDNGFGCSATEANAAALYIFKYSAATSATYSNYRFAPSNVKAPTGLTAGTYYCTSKAIELAQEDGKTIYYTTDGSTPATDNGTEYLSPFSINTSCTVKAIAYDNETEDYSSLIEAEYVIVSSLAAPTMPATQKYYTESFEVEIEHALTSEGAIIHYSYNDASYSNYSSALTITDDKTVWAYVTIGELTSEKVSATYTKGMQVLYKKITSASELKAGMEFIFVSNTNSGYYAAGAINDTYLQKVDISFPDNSGLIAIEAEAVRDFKLGGESGAWTFTSDEGQLYCNGEKKLNYSETGAGTWAITFANGVSTISSTTSDNGKLKYNASSPRFTTYASSGNDVAIYKRLSYRRSVTEGRYGTICLPTAGVMKGGSVYEIAYYSQSQKKIFFDEVINGVMEAAMPYIFLPDEGSSQIQVLYTDANEEDEALSNNGLYGHFDTSKDENAADASKKLVENDYFLYNNQYYRVDEDAVGLVAVGNYRAYIKLSEVEGYPTAPAPGRRRVSMDVHSEQVATELENVAPANAIAPQKVLIDGRMFIILGEKMYDVTGQIAK